MKYCVGEYTFIDTLKLEKHFIVTERINSSQF